MTRSRELAKILTDGNLTGTLDVAGITTSNAGVKVDNITIDGTEIDLSSGDLTVDVAGDIILSAAGGEIRFDDGSQQEFVIDMNDASTKTVLRTLVSDADLTIEGNDGGVGFTALTLDMSAAGAATFNGNITAEGGDYLLRNSSGSSILSIISGTSGSSILKLGDTADFDIGQIEYNHGSNFLAIKTNDSERMRIDASGNVGIGTSSPGAKLDVHGNVEFGDGGGFDMNINGNRHQFSIGGTEHMRLTSDGRLGIGTSSPTVQLHVKGTSSANNAELRLEEVNGDIVQLISISDEFRIGTVAANPIAFRTGNTERMRIESTGRVAIGRTSSYQSAKVTIENNAHGNYLYMGGSTENNRGLLFTSSVGSTGAAYLGAKHTVLAQSGGGEMVFKNDVATWFNLLPTGPVTQPKLPMFQIAGTSAVSTTTTGVLRYTTANVFDSSTEYDPDSLFNGANGRFTAPVAGRYFFILTIGVSFTSGYHITFIRKNGASVAAFNRNQQQESDYDIQVIQGIMNLAENDYITAERQNNYATGGVLTPMFCGFLLG